MKYNIFVTSQHPMEGGGQTQFSQDVNRIGSIPAQIQGPIWGTVVHYSEE